MIRSKQEYKNVIKFRWITTMDSYCRSENGNPEAEFTVEKLTAFEVKVWPTISLNLVTVD